MAEMMEPIVVDLGKKSRKKIKQLSRGDGSLMDDVMEAVAQVRSGMGPEAAGKAFVPVILVYKREKKRKGPLIP